MFEGSESKTTIYALHNSRQRLGLNTSILKTVCEHRKPIPVDYLAKIYGRQREEIQPYLNKLEDEGLVTVVMKGDRSYVKQK